MDIRRFESPRSVFLIGFQLTGNLGLGYLSSSLRERGYRVVVFDVETAPERLLDAIERDRPVLIGFSLIFQFYVTRFGAMIGSLRRHGVHAHVTIGGHFPSLSYEQTLQLIPELDSVVRFEGELTLIELVDALSEGRDWRAIAGLAHVVDGTIVSNPLRTLLPDLDSLPFPDRDFEPNAIVGRLAMPIVASRGCARTCSFCSIHMFYRTAPGKVVRTRKPSEVVREMRTLLDERGISVFLFQDDDFPLFGPLWKRWTRDFLSELHRAGLPGRAVWKINCRADAVDEELFAEMREAGLYLVYMGLESGSDEGLETLHKLITAEQNVRAVEILKKLDIMYEFGFMMFDPSTTFESIAENTAFLRRIARDGSAAVAFCRMIPYDGTPIKDTLASQGRLRGDVLNPDYDFLDPRVEAFYTALTDVVSVTGWIHGLEGLSAQLNFAHNEVAIVERRFTKIDVAPYRAALRRVTAQSNEILLRVVDEMAAAFGRGTNSTWSESALREACSSLRDEFLDARTSFFSVNEATLSEQIDFAITA